MSWIFGISSEIPSEIMRDEPNVHPPALYTNRDETLYIAAGSRSGSIQIPASTRGEWKWIVCGIGIKPDNDDYPAFLSSYQWDTLLQSPEPDLNSIDGHFVAVRWCKQCIEFFTDRCGLRDLYIAKKTDPSSFPPAPTGYLKRPVRLKLTFGRSVLVGYALINYRIEASLPE